MVSIGLNCISHSNRLRPRLREQYDNEIHGFAGEAKPRAVLRPRRLVRLSPLNDDAARCEAAEKLMQYRRLASLRLAVGAAPPQLTVQKVRIPLWALAAIGQHHAGLVFGQVLFHLHPDFRERRGAHPPAPHRGLHGWWRAMPARALAAKIGLSENEVRKAIQRLKRLGWIRFKVSKFAGRNAYHLWLGPNAVAAIETARAQAAADLVERAVNVPLWAMQATGGKTKAALLLGRLWWMLLKDQGLWADGLPLSLEELEPEHWWLATSIGELARRENVEPAVGGSSLPALMLRPHQYKYSAAALVEAGLIQLGYHDFGRGRRPALRLHYDACCVAILQASGWELPVELANAVAGMEEFA